MKSLKEVNKNIAEFMGWYGSSTGRFFNEMKKQMNYIPKYHKSLDAQIPVFEKIAAGYVIDVRKNLCNVEGLPPTYIAKYNAGIFAMSNTPAEASARALDAAIDELKK